MFSTNLHTYEYGYGKREINVIIYVCVPFVWDYNEIGNELRYYRLPNYSFIFVLVCIIPSIIQLTAPSYYHLLLVVFLGIRAENSVAVEELVKTKTHKHTLTNASIYGTIDVFINTVNDPVINGSISTHGIKRYYFCYIFRHCKSLYTI